MAGDHRADELWALLTGGGSVAVGSAPPEAATNRYVPAGSVTEVEAPLVLEYDWLHDNEPVGRVRWQIVDEGMMGIRVELTQMLPASLADRRAPALAAWHTHLELFFARAHGAERPWPEGRTEELEKGYLDLL